MNDSIIKSKSRVFAIRVIRLYQYLQDEKKEFIMSKQLLRSGTSIGANAHEAYFGQSRKDFISKMQIALKEASETEYWLSILTETGYIEEKHSVSILEDCRELAKLLHATVKTSKEK